MKLSHRLSLFSTFAFMAGLLIVAGSVRGQGILGIDGNRPVQLSIEMPTAQFAVGEPVRMTIRTNADAWVYVFSTDAIGITRQIFPNSHHRDHHVRGVRSVSLPGSHYSLFATGPEGDATISAFATTQRFDWMRTFDLWGHAGESFPIRTMAPVEFRARLEQSIADSRRAMDVERERVPSRTIQSSVTPAVRIENVSAWRAYPTCGYATRTIRITSPRGFARPGQPTLPFREDLFSHHGLSGSSFVYGSSRGSISQSRTIIVPSHRPGYIYPPATEWCPPGYAPVPYRPPSYRPPSYHPPTNPYRPPSSGPVRLSSTSISSSPSGADVVIDGRHWGRTPLTVRLAPGSYDVLVERRGYYSEHRTIRIREGRSESVRFSLDRERR